MDVVQLRRDFHTYPELGFTEFRTASIVVERLQSLGFEVFYGSDVVDTESRRGVPTETELQSAYDRALALGANPSILARMKGGLTGVVGVLNGNRPGPVVAIRVDMDALPILESLSAGHLPMQLEFRSQHDGVMHACGHDGHTAIGLAFAERMATTHFAGTLKIIFQPAEEGGRGAFAMMQKGIVDDVDDIFCLHLGLDVPSGVICGGIHGALASTKLEVEFIGVPSHAGASPEKGRNALLGAATALLNIHAIPRFSSGVTRINVGVLEGGTAANIIPYHARMIVETRAETSQVNQELEDRVRNIIAHSAQMHELGVKIRVIGGGIAIACDEDLVRLAMEEAASVPLVHSVRASQLLGGSEDASFLIDRVQSLGGRGTYVVVGSHIPAPHHNERFDIHEDDLQIGVDLLHRIALRSLQEGRC